MKLLWEILVPTHYNDGTEIPVENHREWDAQVRLIAGGLTILKSAKGQWVAEDGVVFAEGMIPVRIACSEEEMRKIGCMTLCHYKQKKVMFYKISNHVVILSVKD